MKQIFPHDGHALVVGIIIPPFHIANLPCCKLQTYLIPYYFKECRWRALLYVEKYSLSFYRAEYYGLTTAHMMLIDLIPPNLASSSNYLYFVAQLKGQDR